MQQQTSRGLYCAHCPSTHTAVGGWAGMGGIQRPPPSSESPTSVAKGMWTANANGTCEVDAVEVERSGEHSVLCRWRVHGISKVRARALWSHYFAVGGYDCRLLVYPKGDSQALPGYLSIYLQVSPMARGAGELAYEAAWRVVFSFASRHCATPHPTDKLPCSQRGRRPTADTIRVGGPTRCCAMRTAHHRTDDPSAMGHHCAPQAARHSAVR